MRTAALIAMVLVGSVAAPVVTMAERAGKVHRIGFLSTASRAEIRELLKALEEGLIDAGYTDGRNAVIIHRFAEGKPERLPALAGELVRLSSSVIVATSTPAALAVKRATTGIPIVMVSPADPVMAGLVASLARPGGNITGVTLEVTPDTAGKQLQLLSEVVPNAKRVGVLWNPAYPSNAPRWTALQDSARRLSLALVAARVRTSGEIDSTFAAMVRQGASAVLVLGDPLTFSLRIRIGDLARTTGLVTMSPYREGAEAGGLMAYGPDFRHMYRRAAVYVDRILKGANPGDLPVEQPTMFELLINLKTAKQIGLTIPPSVLMRADQVIE